MQKQFLSNLKEYYNLNDNWLKRKTSFYVFLRSAIVSVLYGEGYNQRDIANILDKDHSTISTINTRHDDKYYLDIRTVVYEIYLETLVENAEESLENYISIVSSIKKRIESDEQHPLITAGKNIESQKIEAAGQAIEFTIKSLGGDSSILFEGIFNQFKQQYRDAMKNNKSK